MIKLMTHFLVLLVFAAFGSANAYYDKDTGDVQAALKTPTAALKKGSDFAAHVTKPFAENPKSKMDFFSNPKDSREDWNKKYKDWTKKTNNPTAFKIFETMGTSHRGILNNADKKYNPIADAQKTGMLSIVAGSLGLKKDRSLTKDEEAIAARELLTIGHSMEDGVFNTELKKLEEAHKVPRLTPKQKRHLQISALYMLTGHKSEIKTGTWYTKDLKDLGKLQDKIKGYAEGFLPKVEPKDVVISKLLYQRQPQKNLWGTPGIKASGLHAGLQAKFPNTMVLGSYDVPRSDTFSITAEVFPGHYFVVMVPEVCDRNPVLRPQYMEVDANDSISDGGKGTTKATIFYQGQKAQDLSINWDVTKGSERNGVKRKVLSKVEPTEQRDNDGQVTCIHPDVIQTGGTYSFIAHVGDKKFYYWRPESAQIDALREFFAADRQYFTFGELYDYLQGMDGAIKVGKGILGDIEKIRDGRLENFSEDTRPK